MKRLFSILLSSLFFATSMWAAIEMNDINSYAARLTLPDGGVVSKTHTVDVKFYVMAPTKGVWVYLDADRNGSFETLIYEDADLEIAKNTNTIVTCTLPNSLAPGEYRWAVKVQGKESHDWTEPHVVRNYENTDVRYLFKQAMGVAVDCSYDSPYFGFSYVTESHGGTTEGVKFSNGNTYKRETKDGIYIFGPAMGEVSGGWPYVGGVSWCTESKNYERGPFRVCTDDEGYVYVCENRPSADYPDDILVRRMHPSDLTKNMQAVLMQSDVPSGIAGRIHSIAIARNSSGQKVLHAILGGTSNGSLTENSGRLCSFIMDDRESPISISHQRTINLYEHGLLNIYTSIQPGINGDLWVAQHRASGNPEPVLMHINNEGNIDYKLLASTRCNLRGAVALSKDGSIIAIPTIMDSKYVVRCYKVNYGDKITLTGLYNINIPIMNNYTGNEYVEGMAFDVANNLYFVSGNNSNQNVDRLYVYALPKADNSHITPARSNETIKVSDAICWHPYPDSYSMTNEDLFEMFKRDYKAKYGRDCDFSLDTYSSEFEYMLTNANSQWKWLGDFFNRVGAQRRNIPTNEELWGTDNSSQYPTDGIKKEYNTWLTNQGIAKRSNQKITDAAVFFAVDGAASKSTYNFLTNNTKYKWLGDYIKQVANAQNKTLSSSYAYWHWVAHAFFNKDKNFSDAVNGGEYTHNIDFSSAGEPSHWRAAYLAGMKAQGVDVTINNDPINQASEWRVCAGTFFGQLPTETSQGFVTTNIYNKREHEHWYALWLASLPKTREAVKANGFPVPVRKDHILAGWYYGTKCETGTKAYNIYSPATTDIEYACVYARWIETCLHEGEVIDPQMSKEQQATYRNFNIDLINLLSGQEVAIKIDRKLVGGMYNTMCLPFDIAGKEAFSQIVYADGPGSPFAKEGGVYPFSLVKYVGTVAGDDVLMLDFDELGAAETLPANTPFLLKPNADITTPLKYNAARIIGGGAQPASDEDDNEEVNNTLGQNYGITVGDGDEYFTYTGVLAPTTIPDGSVLLVADNRLAQSTGGEMKGMRGFFTAKIQPLEMPAVVRITSRDGVTTYLDAINMTTESKTATKVLQNGQIYILRGDEIYTLTGARVK